MSQIFRNDEEDSIKAYPFSSNDDDDNSFRSDYTPERKQFPLINKRLINLTSQNEDPNEGQNNSIEKEDEDAIQNKPQLMKEDSENIEGELDFKNDSPLADLHIPNLPQIIDKEQIQKEIQNEKENNNSDNAYKNTRFTSKEENIINNPILISSQTKKPQIRIDYAIKNFKTHFSNFIKQSANELIKKSDLPKILKKIQLSSPNRISFTGNPTEKDNYKFLSFTVEEMFCYYKNEKCQVSHQKSNKENIKTILQYIEGSKNEGKYQNVKSFFKMSLKDAYTLFYNSPNFQKYAADPKTIVLDKEFQAEKHFSLLEKNAFIKTFEMNRKK